MVKNARKQFFFSLWLALCLALVGAGSAWAQTDATSGQIVGTVKDPNGAFVPGATVTVTNPATGLTRTLTTNDQGGFRAVQLPPGTYTINVTSQGFGQFTQTGYKVEVGSAIAAEINLQVSAVNEEVLVTSASVDTTQQAAPVVVNQTSISELPINGRRFQDFVLLTPTADVDPVRNQISLAGQRGINSNIQIDGADYNNPFFGGIRGGERSNQAFTFPQESIREFQVVASGYTAEFGRSTGGIVNVVTKSGSNEWHGSAFYVRRDERWADKNAFGQESSPTQNQYGASLGGRIIPNRLFFFFAYEGQKLDQQRLVLFDRLRLVNPATTAGVQEAYSFYQSLEGPFVQTNDADALVGRVDIHFNDRNQFNLRYNYSKNTALNAVSTGTSLNPATTSALSNNGTEGNKQNTGVAQLTSFFSSNVVNELRGQYSRENRPRLANDFSPNVNNTFGDYGTRSFLPTTQYDYRVQIADNLTWNRGTHSFKFGGDFNYAFADQLFAFNQPGNFFFFTSDPTTVLRILTVGNAGGSSDPANRFDSTSVGYRRAIGNGLASLDSTELSFFAQDSWRIVPNFTLNLGLRWESQYMPQPDTSNTTLTNLVANANFPINRGPINPAIIPDQTDQFGPRLGFAWDPWKDGKTVIRGYSGIYYARTPLLTLAGPMNNFRATPGDVRLEISGFTAPCANGIANNDPRCPSTIYKQFLTIGINLNNFTLDKLPILTPQQLQQIAANVATARGQTTNPFNGLQLVTVGDQLENPQSTQFGLAVERELRGGLTLGATFDYVNTSNLNINFDYNVPRPFIRPNDLSRRPFYGIGTATPTAFAQTRPIAEIGNAGFVQVREAAGRSRYQALTLRAQLRRAKYQFDTFYTLGYNKDNDSTERNATFSEYDDLFNFDPEYNWGRGDRRHQLVFNSVFNLPLGFQASGTGRFRSGTPIDVSVSSIIAPANSGLTNAQYAALVTLSGNTTGDLNQDRGNFSDRPYILPGVSMQRNEFRNTAFYNVDIRLQRDFRLGEKFRISPSFEVFNLFDTSNIRLSGTTVTNYGNPGVNERTGETLAPSNPNFLRLRDNNGNLILSNLPGSPRQMQAGIRFNF